LHPTTVQRFALSGQVRHKARGRRIVYRRDDVLQLAV
jgi:hypothetical protein